MDFLPQFHLTQNYHSLKGDKSLPLSKPALLSGIFSEQYAGYLTIQNSPNCLKTELMPLSLKRLRNTNKYSNQPKLPVIFLN